MHARYVLNIGIIHDPSDCAQSFEDKSFIDFVTDTIKHSDIYEGLTLP